MSEPIVIQGISESGQKLILDIADKLRAGWTGELRIAFHEGGVRDAEQTERWKPKDARE